MNQSDINDVFESIYITIISNIQKSLGKGSCWIIDSVIEHNISVSKCNPLAGSSYIKLSEELDHRRKGLINIKNINDNECFKWSIVRYLNPSDHHLSRIIKADQDFVKKLDLKDINCPVICIKLQKNNSIVVPIRVFGYRNKEKHPLYVSKKCCEEKHVRLLIMEENRKRCYVLKKDSNTFMYNHTLHCRKKMFVVIVYKILVQQKYQNFILKTALKLMANKEL